MSELNTIREAIDAIAAGKFVVVVDDEDRENEGDLVCAAELISPDIVNFMASKGKGLICLTLTSDKCAHLDLPMMTEKNKANHGTAFTVSICLLYTSPSPRDGLLSRMPSSA